MTRINQFDDDAMRTIAHEMSRLRNQVHNLAEQLGEIRALSDSPGFKPFTGKTTTNSTYATYPTTGCKFLVQRIDKSWDDGEVNECDAAQDATLGHSYVCRTVNGRFLIEDTPVIAFHIPGTHGGRWYCIPQANDARIGKLGTTLTTDTVGTVTLWDQSGSSVPAPTTETESGINISGQTLKNGVFVTLTDVYGFDKPIIEPIELLPC